MAHEKWRDVVGYEGYYQVSDLGRVRSLDRIVPCKGGVRVHRGKMLKLSDGNPYLHVVLSKQNVQKPVRVHRLVAEAFVPNPDLLPYVDHINCDKTDNRARNLRWCTPRENTHYACENGLMTELKPFQQWTPEQRQRYREKRRKPVVRDDGRLYPSCREAAEDIGVAYSAVMHVLRGRARTCHGHTYRYANK